MEYPRRFYTNNKKEGKKKLKYPKERIRQCVPCGTFILLQADKPPYCSKRCKQFAEFFDLTSGPSRHRV